MSNFGTKVITGRLPQSVPITYFIELFTKFSSAGSCYYIQTLLSWQGDKLQNITHTVTELLHLYSWCLPRVTLTCDNVHHGPVWRGVGGQAGVVAAVHGQGLVYHQAALQLTVQHCSGQLHAARGLQHPVVDCPVNHCSLHVESVPALVTTDQSGWVLNLEMGQTSGPKSTLQTIWSP